MYMDKETQRHHAFTLLQEYMNDPEKHEQAKKRILYLYLSKLREDPKLPEKEKLEKAILPGLENKTCITINIADVDAFANYIYELEAVPYSKMREEYLQELRKDSLDENELPFHYKKPVLTKEDTIKLVQQINSLLSTCGRGGRRKTKRRKTKRRKGVKTIKKYKKMK